MALFIFMPFLSRPTCYTHVMQQTQLIEKIHLSIKKNNLFPQGSKVILGLSGGPDSVFLLHVLAPLHEKGNIQLIAAHLDHEWRSESGNDVKFCQNLAQKFNIPLITRKISELHLSLKFNGSREEYARKARRHFFELIKKEYDANVIALAHHAQDQQETFFIRILRGATLTGLSAMKIQQDSYVRPLLHTNKTEILDYLHTHHIAYLIDSTNNSDAYLRNRIRMHVLPALQQCDKRFDINFASTLTRLQETESFLQELTDKTFHEIAQKNTDHWGIDISALLALHPMMRYRIILYWLCAEHVPFTPTQKFFDEMLRFLNMQNSGSHQMHHTWSLVKKKNNVCISRNPDKK